MRLRSLLAFAAVALWSASASALSVEVSFSRGQDPGASGSEALNAPDLGSFAGAETPGGWEVIPVPEPLTALMLGGGLMGLTVSGRKRG